MSALAALVAALGYGAANFAGGVASRRQHAMVTLFISQSIALFLIVAAIIWTGGQPVSLRLGAAAGVAAFCGAWLAYTCFSLGRPIGVAAVLLGTASAAVPVAIGLARGEQPGVLGVAGLIAGVGAIIILGWPKEERTDLKVALLASGAGLAFGSYHTVMSATAPGSGLWPLLASQWVMVSLALIGLCIVRPIINDGKAAILSVSDGGIATVATVAALAAVRGGSLPIAGTLIALSPAATVLLARIFMRERLNLQRCLGLALAAVAVVLLTLPPLGR